MEDGERPGLLSITKKKKKSFFSDADYQRLSPLTNMFHYTLDTSFQRCLFEVKFSKFHHIARI